MRLIYTLNTAKYFVGEHEGHDSEAREAEEEVWPPFKKVGNYCPYSDDPRFAVTKIVFCASNKTMTVAGNGGQVLTFDLSEEETSVEVQVLVIFLNGNHNILCSRSTGPRPADNAGKNVA